LEIVKRRRNVRVEAVPVLDLGVEPADLLVQSVYFLQGVLYVIRSSEIREGVPSRIKRYANNRVRLGRSLS
jgi:hypothetical protein